VGSDQSNGDGRHTGLKRLRLVGSTDRWAWARGGIGLRGAVNWGVLGVSWLIG
jgi:hypothetical protein